MQNYWNAIVDIANGIPWWVYVLFFYLLSIGLRATKTNVISLKRLFVLPILLVAMSIHTLLTAVQFNFFNVAIWVITLIIGIYAGWQQVHARKMRVDKKQLLFEVPGTWSTLILIMLIFVVKFFFGYELAVNPNLVQNVLFVFSMLATSGLFTGFFVGRLVAYLRHLKTEPHVDLIASR